MVYIVQLWIYYLIFLSTVSAQDPNCTSLIGDAEYECLFEANNERCRCFILQATSTRDWENSDPACKAAAPGTGSTRLAVDNTEDTHSLLTALIANHPIRTPIGWVNAEYLPKYWRWLHTYTGVFGKATVYYQGCYNTAAGEFTNSVPNQATVEDCRTSCQPQYKYFTVRQKQDGSFPCYCSNNFDTSRAQGSCGKCVDQTDTWCGDANNDAIYATDATNVAEQYEVWKSGYPRALGNDTLRSTCIAATYNSATSRMEWTNEPCTESKQVVCVRNPGTTGTCDLRSATTGLCYVRVGITRWSSGVTSCSTSAMTMIPMLNKDIEDELISMGLTSLWLAGTSRTWIWNSDIPSEFSTSHWFRDIVPQKDGRECTVLRNTGDWSAFPCTPRPASYFCETVISTATTVPPVETTTRAAATTSPAAIDNVSTTTAPAKPAAGPNVGVIIGIVIVCLLIILVIIFIIILCMKLMRQKKNESEERGDLVKPDNVATTTIKPHSVSFESAPPPYSERTPRSNRYIEKQTSHKVNKKPELDEESETETESESEEEPTFRKQPQQMRGSTPRNSQRRPNTAKAGQYENFSELTDYKPRGRDDPLGDTLDNSVQLHVLVRHDLKPDQRQKKPERSTEASSKLSDNVTVLHLPTVPYLPDVSKELNQTQPDKKRRSSKRRRTRSKPPKIYPSDTSD